MIARLLEYVGFCLDQRECFVKVRVAVVGMFLPQVEEVEKTWNKTVGRGSLCILGPRSVIGTSQEHKDNGGV